MTTPSTFPSIIRIITYAMQDAGLLADGDNPNSDQLAQYQNRLNDLVNFWGTQGLKLWTYLDQSITLTAGTNEYYLGPGGSIITAKPLRAIQGYYLDSNANRRPIYPISWDEWMRLSQVTQQGEISQFFVNKQRENLIVTFWLTPDSNAATNGTAHLLIPRQINNSISLTEDIDFPQEWFMALRWGLADEICTGQPQAIMDRCSQRAIAFRTAVEDWDVEDTETRFAPDSQRMNLGNSRFR